MVATARLLLAMFNVYITSSSTLDYIQCKMPCDRQRVVIESILAGVHKNSI